MVSVPVKNDSSGRKGLADLNYHMRDEHKEVRAKVVGEGQVLSQEDESKINEVSKVTNESEGVFQTQYGLQKLQQQPQVPVVRWERFLPLRSLKVLLVENDDSTRHIVSALLRNCSYEVIAAANGLQAWKLLQDLTNHIDLVLTEVVMPCLSGIDLLCKIMSHKTCKNIPVIMMSSHDSMGIVFQCLSKGAVDFLVKPIRKNELKNLWQHVWRRCHSSSGSGSESGIQNQKHSESKSAEDSGNNTGSNNEDDNGSIGLNARYGSDNGSGTQSSWTKRAVDIDSPQPLSPWNQLAETRDTTCVQVIHSKPEAFGNEWVPTRAAQELPEQDEQLDLKMALPRNPALQSEFPNEKVAAFLTGSRHDTLPELETQKHNDQLDKEAQENSSENLINVITNSIDPNVENTDSISPNGLLKVSEINDKAFSDTKEIASLELTLKRPRGDGDARTPICDNRNVLRHSDFSAFTRYNTTSATNQATTGNVGSCYLPNQGSNGSSNNNDMGSTTKNIFTKPATFTEKSESTSTMHNTHICPPQQVKPGGTHEKVQVQHHYHHYHHHHHHHHNTQKQPPDHTDFSLKNMEVATPQCGSSNMLRGSIDCNHGSASGSNHGSNTAMNTAGMNMDTDNGIKGEACGISGSGNGLHQNRNAQREAALIKFRQKKKARCFEKKVRYHSRKRLAEQRPRVRGQFVRQMATEHKNQNEDS